jgi:NAD(P)-dependent dehydrogenase (short-subunit alcohol dehydrogenase family)
MGAPMSKQEWLITGAGRGMGADFARAALAAGHSVVATGRNPDSIAKTLGDSPALLAVTLADTRSAVHQSVHGVRRSAHEDGMRYQLYPAPSGSLAVLLTSRCGCGTPTPGPWP